MTEIATLQTIQVGTPHRYPLPRGNGQRNRSWTSSFVRTPSPERRWLATTHLEGNDQADKKNHGSLNQAVLLYAAAHYPLWREELGRPDIGPGGFGENFTVDGLTEETACIGDTYAVGEARIQVTGPRYPCYKIGRRWGISGLTRRVAQTGRTGWYARVLEEGWVEPGLPILLLERPYPDITVALVNDLAHGRNTDPEQARQVAACALLETWWQELVERQVLGVAA